MNRAIKPRTCRACKTAFTPVMPLAVCCSPVCALQVARAKREKAERATAIQERRVTQEKMEKFKRLPDWIADTQKVFNKFVRLRDQLAGHTCISSGRVLDWSGNGVDAGHFRSRGSAPHLRFDERNCHSQSKYENRYMSGNAPGYRIGLIARIGIEAVQTLEADQKPRKYTIDDLKALKAHYAAKVKELQATQKQMETA